MIEPSLVPVRDLGRRGGGGRGHQSDYPSYVAGADLDQSRNFALPGSAEHISNVFDTAKELWIQGNSLGPSEAASDAYSAAQERLKDVTLARGFHPGMVSYAK